MDDDTTTHQANATNVTNPIRNLSDSFGLGPGSGMGTTTGTGTSGLSNLERDVLDEYERLAGNMRMLNSTLTTLSSGPMTLEIAEGLRLLERKVASVYTLMKASVYSIVLQQGQIEGDEDASRDGDRDRVHV